MINDHPKSGFPCFVPWGSTAMSSRFITPPMLSPSGACTTRMGPTRLTQTPAVASSAC